MIHPQHDLIGPPARKLADLLLDVRAAPIRALVAAACEDDDNLRPLAISILRSWYERGLVRGTFWNGGDAMRPATIEEVDTELAKLESSASWEPRSDIGVWLEPTTAAVKDWTTQDPDLVRRPWRIVEDVTRGTVEIQAGGEQEAAAALAQWLRFHPSSSVALDPGGVIRPDSEYPIRRIYRVTTSG